MTITKMSWLVGIQCLLSVTLFCSDEWDPDLYGKNNGPQRRWFQTLLAREEPRNILDLGCGDGGITADLADKYPNANVVGIDISKKMIAHANKTHKRKNLSFFVGDAERDLLFYEQFDLVFSSSTLHRLNNPEEAVRGIFNALRTGGKFIGTFPITGSQLYTDALATVDNNEKWKPYLPQKQRKNYKLSVDIWRERFEAAGFTVGSINSLAHNEPFYSRQAFRDFLRCTSIYRSLLGDQREIEFFEEVVDEYLTKSPVNEDGTITLQLTRLEIIAYKIEKPKL